MAFPHGNPDSQIYDGLDERGREEYLRHVGVDPDIARARVAMLAAMLRDGMTHDEISRILRADVEETRRRLRASRAGNLH